MDLDILPAPIALPFRRIKACHNKDARRLTHILQTAEITAKLLAIIVLSDIHDQIEKGTIEFPAILQRPIENLRRPSFGHWIEVIREGVRFLCGNEAVFIPELREFVFGSKIGTPSPSFKLLNDTVAIRNQFAHGGMKPAEISRACDQCEKMVQEILTNLDFFANYKLFYVKQINVSKRRLTTCSYTHQFCLLAGPYIPPDAITEQREWHTDTDEIILHKDNDAYINLSPFIIYLDSDFYDEDSGVIPDIYIFNGYEKHKERLNIFYLPCGSSGKEFGSKDLSDEIEKEILGQELSQYLKLN